jgi:hypothetical protein
MLSHWEEFIIDPSRRTLVPSATLQPSGELRIGRSALEMLGDPEAVAILFDRGNRRIGLRRADLGEANALRLYTRSRNRRTYAKYIYLKSFLNRHGLHPDTTLLFRPVTLSPEGYLILDLESAVPSASRRTAKSADSG